MDIKYLSIYGLSFRKSRGKIFHFEFPLFKMANKAVIGNFLAVQWLGLSPKIKKPSWYLCHFWHFAKNFKVESTVKKCCLYPA